MAGIRLPDNRAGILSRLEQERFVEERGGGIKIAEYMTELPKRELLEQKLHKAVETARKEL